MNKLLLFFMFLLLSFASINSLSASTLVGSVSNRPNPFGPLPAFTTNIFWVNQTTSHDYVDIIYQGTVIKRRLRNQLLPGTSGTVQIRDPWNGQDDKGANLPSGTYDVNVKMSRTATYERKIPANDRSTYQEFQSPTDIACDKFGNVYVLDIGLGTVQKFSSDGAFIWKWTIPAGAGLSFPTPITGGIAVCTNLYVYVSGQASTGRGRICKMDQNGALIGSYNAPAANNDNLGKMGYTKEYDRIFTAASAGGDNALGVNCSTMAIWDNNTGGNLGARDFSILNVGTRDWIYYVFNNDLYRWYMTAGGADSFPDTTDTPQVFANGLLTDTVSITHRSNKYLYVVGNGATGNRIRAVSTNGTFIANIGSFGHGDTNFWAPSGIAWDEVNDYLWVSDTSNQRLVCYKCQKCEDAGDLSFVKKVETSPYLFNNPIGLTIDDSGNLFVVDNIQCNVKKFDQFGNFLMKFGGKGTGAGYFWNPQGIAVDNEGYIYVSDLGTADGNDAQDQIEKYDSDGNFVLSWDHPDGRGLNSFVRNSSNFIIAIGQTDGAGRDCAIRVYTSTGTVIQSFRNSYDDTDYGDVDIDFTGRFYCLDSSGGAYLDTYIDTSAGSTSPTYVNLGGQRFGLSIDAFGSIWVPNRSANTIETRQPFVFGSPATTLFSFGTGGAGNGQFNAPTVCAIRVRSLPGNWADFWINDTGNDRLQKFIINWGSEGTVQTTIANAGRPIVTAAYPDTSLSTNANYYVPEAQYYVRQGKSTFKVLFSQNMNTNLKPTVEYITADSSVYTISRSSYINNIWIGTAWIPTGKDGSVSIRVQNAFNSAGSNINPNPTILANAFIIDTTPPVVNLINPTYGFVTAMTSIQVNGTTDPGIRIDVYNYQASSGTTIISSATNQYSDETGYFMVSSLKMRTPKDSSNFITARALDKAGNWGSSVDPRRLVRCIVAVGFAYVLPSTNRRLGDVGLGNHPPFQLVWQANAAFTFGTVTFDVPSGWSAPSTNSASPGYVRLFDSSGITFTTSKTLWTGVVPGRLKVNFDAANLGGYFKIGYGTKVQTMVSNSYSTAIGLNEFVARATNNGTSCTNIWYPPQKVGEYTGQSLYVNVKGKPMRLFASNLMPSQTYKGAFNVPAMRLSFVNSNSYHTNQINTLRFSVLNATGVLVDADTRISSVSLFTEGVLYANASALNSPYVTFDLSVAPLLVSPGKTNSLEVKLNIASDTVATDVRIRLASSDDVSAVNYKNFSAVSIDVVGAFPFNSTYAKINTYLTATRMFTSLSNRSPGWVEAKTVGSVPLKFYLANTNTNVNNIEITKIYFNVSNQGGAGIVPNTVITQASIGKWNSGVTYSSKAFVESSGFQMAFDTIGLYIPPQSSVTLQLKVSIKSNTSVSNFRLVLGGTTNVKARDSIQYTPVTNFQYPGFTFPMSTRNIEVVRYFHVQHDTSALVNTGEPVVFKALNVNRNPVTNYTGIVTVDAVVGTAATIGWATTPSADGILVDLGPASGAAYYSFANTDRGVVTLLVTDATVETIDIMMRSDWRDARSNGLAVLSIAPNVSLSKRAHVTNHPSFIAIGGSSTNVVPGSMITYTIFLTNDSPTGVSNLLLQDRLKTNLILVPDSIYLNGVLQTEAWDGVDTTDYGVLMTNTITSTLKLLPGNSARKLIYRVYVK